MLVGVRVPHRKMPTVVLRTVALSALMAASLATLVACSRLGSKPAEIVAPPPQPVTVADIQKMAKDPAAKAILVNVWASWCMPCRDELPALVMLQHQLSAKGLKLILVSADFDVPMEKLTTFLGSQGVDFPTFLKVEKDQDFMKALSPDWAGAIPATFLYTNDGELFDFWEGKATAEVFASKVREAMAASEQLAASGAVPAAPVPATTAGSP